MARKGESGLDTKAGRQKRKIDPEESLRKAQKKYLGTSKGKEAQSRANASAYKERKRKVALAKKLGLI